MKKLSEINCSSGSTFPDEIVSKAFIKERWGIARDRMIEISKLLIESGRPGVARNCHNTIATVRDWLWAIQQYESIQTRERLKIAG